MSVLSTASNRASGNGNASTTAWVNDTSTPADAAFDAARAIMFGDASTPKTSPVGPMCRFAAIASVPVPHPTSSTDSPGPICANATSRSRNARSLPCVSSQARRSYRAAQWSTRPVVVDVVGVDGVMPTDSVDFDRETVKNTSSRHVRKRTSTPGCPETRDRRVTRTRASLRDALISLAREKPYDAIAVKEILNRANVGRSTFYMHFRDKDELLLSGIHEILQSHHGNVRSGSSPQEILAFSLPFLEYVDRHRRANGPGTRHEGHALLHAHLRDALTEMLEDGFAIVRRRAERTSEIPAALLARHVASTFVLVLDWWVESGAALTPAEVDARFRALVLPALSSP